MVPSDPHSTTDAKRALRARVLAQRDALAVPVREALSRRIMDRLLDHPALLGARCVLAFASIGSEVQTALLLQSCLRRGQRLVLPKVNRGARRLDLYAVQDLSKDLAPGTWDIPEPCPDRCDLLTDRALIDVVVAPGAAFTVRCERTGYGGGFYDRLLENWPGAGRFIAPAFDEQMVEALPLSAQDVRMHEVITPTQHYRAPA